MAATTARPHADSGDGVKYFRLLVLLIPTSLSAFGQTSEGGRFGLWSARGEYGEEFTCSLDNYAINAAATEIPTTDRLTLYFVWNASRGLTLNVWGRPLGKVRMHVEAVGNSDAWDVDFDERRILLSGADAEKLVDHIGAGRDVMITLSYPGKEPQRFLARERGAEVAVPLYRACVVAAAAGVAPVQTGDGELIFQMIDDERCGFRQWFSFDDFPVGLSLWVGKEDGEFTFSRSTISGTPHGGRVKRRQQPDQVDAVSLFGGTFSLMEDWEFRLALDQADAIAADLLAGKSRAVTLTEPSGVARVLEFGGAHARPSAAMMAACRRVLFRPGRRAAWRSARRRRAAARRRYG